MYNTPIIKAISFVLLSASLIAQGTLSVQDKALLTAAKNADIAMAKKLIRTTNSISIELVYQILSALNQMLTGSSDPHYKFFTIKGINRINKDICLIFKIVAEIASKTQNSLECLLTDLLFTVFNSEKFSNEERTETIKTLISAIQNPTSQALDAGLRSAFKENSIELAAHLIPHIDPPYIGYAITKAHNIQDVVDELILRWLVDAEKLSKTRYADRALEHEETSLKGITKRLFIEQPQCEIPSDLVSLIVKDFAGLSRRQANTINSHITEYWKNKRPRKKQKRG